jgi:putative IMPACT (imprinted ancient) family translation regulator
MLIKLHASLALQLTPAIKKSILINYQLQFDYTKMNDVMKIVKQFDCIVLHQEMKLFCSIQIGIAKRNSVEILSKLKELPGVEVEMVEQH